MPKVMWGQRARRLKGLEEDRDLLLAIKELLEKARNWLAISITLLLFNLKMLSSQKSPSFSWLHYIEGGVFLTKLFYKFPLSHFPYPCFPPHL